MFGFLTALTRPGVFLSSVVLRISNQLNFRRLLTLGNKPRGGRNGSTDRSNVGTSFPLVGFVKAVKDRILQEPFRSLRFWQAMQFFWNSLRLPPQTNSNTVPCECKYLFAKNLRSVETESELEKNTFQISAWRALPLRTFSPA